MNIEDLKKQLEELQNIIDNDKKEKEAALNEQNERAQLEKQIEELKKQHEKNQEEINQIRKQNTSNTTPVSEVKVEEEPEEEKDLDAHGDEKDLEKYDYSEDGKTRTNKETGIIEVATFGKEYKWVQTYHNLNQPFYVPDKKEWVWFKKDGIMYKSRDGKNYEVPITEEEYNTISNKTKQLYVELSFDLPNDIKKNSKLDYDIFKSFQKNMNYYRCFEQAKKNQDKILEILETAKNNVMDSNDKKEIQAFISKISNDDFYKLSLKDQIKEYEKIKKYIDEASYKELRESTIKFNYLTEKIQSKAPDALKEAIDNAKKSLDDSEKVLDAYRDGLTDEDDKEEINDYKNIINTKYEEYYKYASDLAVARGRVFDKFTGNNTNRQEQPTEAVTYNQTNNNNYYVIDEDELAYQRDLLIKRENSKKSFIRAFKKLGFVGGVALIGTAIYSLPVGILAGAATLGIKSIKPEKALDEYESNLTGNIYYDTEKFKASQNQNERAELEKNIRANMLEKQMVQGRRNYRWRQFGKYAAFAAATSIPLLPFLSLGLSAAIGTGIQFGRWAAKDLDKTQEEENEYIDMLRRKVIRDEKNSVQASVSNAKPNLNQVPVQTEQPVYNQQPVQNVQTYQHTSKPKTYNGYTFTDDDLYDLMNTKTNGMTR